MKTACAGLAALLVSTAPAAAHAEEACAGGPGGVRLSVEVTGVRNTEGDVAVTVYPDDPHRFLAPGGKLLRVRTPARAPTTTACFDLPAGAYAVLAHHDANRDHQMNRDWKGFPSEGFGFSNDAPTPIGFPAFKAARFVLKAGDPPLRVRMRYVGAPASR